MRRQNDFLFARMGAARDPGWTTGCPLAAKTRDFGVEIRRDIEIELDAARNFQPGLVRAEDFEPARRFGVLAEQVVDILQHGARQTGDAGIAAGGPFRQTGIDEAGGRAAPPRLVEDVRPQFGFHQHQRPRPDAAQEPGDNRGIVVGRVTVIDDVAQPVEDLLATGRRRGGHQEPPLGHPGLEAANHRRRPDRLSRGNRVEPDHVPSDVVGHPAPAFVTSLGVSGLAPGPREQAQPDDGQGEQQQQVVDNAHRVLPPCKEPRLASRSPQWSRACSLRIVHPRLCGERAERLAVGPRT